MIAAYHAKTDRSASYYWSKKDQEISSPYAFSDRAKTRWK